MISKMTWKSILDEKLLRYESVTKAAIYGRDGTCFASSSNLTVSPTEIRALDKGITNEPPILYNGISIGGERYNFLGCEPGFSVFCCLKKSGFVIVRTNRCIILVEYSSEAQSGQCYALIERLAEKLKIHEF